MAEPPDVGPEGRKRFIYSGSLDVRETGVTSRAARSVSMEPRPPRCYRAPVCTPVAVQRMARPRRSRCAAQVERSYTHGQVWCAARVGWGKTIGINV